MAKIYSMRLFEVTPELTISCTCEDTRSGFKHVARIIRNSWMTGHKPVKICYYNRTWESFEFESVLCLLADKSEGLSEAERIAIRNLR